MAAREGVSMTTCLKAWCQILDYAKGQITFLLSSCKQANGFIGLQETNDSSWMENFLLRDWKTFKILFMYFKAMEVKYICSLSWV